MHRQNKRKNKDEDIDHAIGREGSCKYCNRTPQQKEQRERKKGERGKANLG